MSNTHLGEQIDENKFSQNFRNIVDRCTLYMIIYLEHKYD